VRIQSKETWSVNWGTPAYLFVLHLYHMPQGCGTWPAWWFCGPNWPNEGEIDVIEGVNQMTNDQTTLHTSDGCSMSGVGGFTGDWAYGSNGQPATNCYVNAAGQYSNQGCSILGAYGSYGVPFNSQGGGTFALLWNQTEISSWYFPR
jgi:hypothetical protein